MLFLTLCWFLPSGTGLIGVYIWNVIYKMASRIPKISTHVIFFKERSVMVKTWINYIVMILYVFVCVFAARMLYNEFSMLYLKGINYCRQILLQHNFCDWKDKKKEFCDINHCTLELYHVFFNINYCELEYYYFC